LPQPVKNLFAIAGLRQLAERIGIARLDVGPQGGRLVFTADTRAEPEAVIRLIQQQPQLYRMDGPHTLRIQQLLEDASERIAASGVLLQQLQPDG
jgi:transcription-repair coupling factor (superfamily II helicase)